MKPLFTSTPILNRVIALALIGVGAAGIGLQAKWLSEKAIYMEYTALVQKVTGVSTMGSILDVCIAGAVIVLLAGLIAMGATFVKRENPMMRITFGAGLALAIIGGIVELAGGIAVLTHPYRQALGPDTYIFNQGRTAEQLTGDKQKMSLFALATFEKCCRPNNWVSQGPFAGCSVPCPSSQSGVFIDTRIEQFKSFFDETDLCTCVPTPQQDTYGAYLNAMGANECGVFKRMTVDFVPSINIPTTCETGACLSLGFVKNTLYRNSVITRVPFVGYQLDAESDPTRQTAAGSGFGCGLGFQKGIMWLQELHHVLYLEPSGTAGLALGAGTIGIVLISFVLIFIISMGDSNEQNGQWEDTLAAKWNDPASEPTNGGAIIAPPATGAAKVENSNWGAPPVSAYQVQANDFTDQLLKFYAKHDPSKSMKEIEGIALWGKQNGLTALNKKLRDKYRVDLSGAQSGEEGPPI